MKITRWGLGLLSLAVLLTSVSNASAWWKPFSHCGSCCHLRHHCFETHITCRPYNAFTPICWGNLTCDGCCPNPCAVASGCMTPSFGGCAPGMDCAGFQGGCTPGGFCGYPGGMLPGYAGAPFQGYPVQGYPGAMQSLPGAPLPQAMPTLAPNYNVPPPANQTTQYGNPAMYYGVQPASYYPGYYYGYPTAYYPSYPAMPYGYGYGNPQRPY
jgi:hypothetical protein